MKICIVGSVFPRSPNDSEVPWHRETIRRCRERGYDVRVYVPSFRGMGDHTVDGIPVTRFRYCPAFLETLTHDEGAPNKVHKFHYKIVALSYIALGTLGLIRLHLREHFDIIHVHWPFPHALFGYAAVRLSPARMVLNFHGASLLMARKFGFVAPFLRFFIGRADAVVVNSGFTAQQVKALCPREVHTIPYGTTLSPKPAVEPPENTRLVLAVGRLIERKGLEYLVRAFPTVVERFPGARLCIVGGGPLQPRLQQIVQGLDMAGHVTLTGKVPQADLERYFARCEMFVLPAVVDSRGDTEGLGVVLIEALSYGKPVIGTNVGGIPDIIVDGKTGLLVESRQPQVLAEAICRILSDKKLAARLADEGYRHVQRIYDWERIVNALCGLYDSLAGPSRRDGK